ncbi:hypothetical protein [Candidatus Palauibacter sp.]|uniref:hypothetical protein n=1 Tax=Candidatus Palauibacter sp. TaxID=3101350 RepID=UPI003B59FF3D
MTRPPGLSRAHATVTRAAVPFHFVLLAAVGTACDSRTAASADTAVSDSAGVRVIELGVDGLGSALHRTLASEPDLVIRSGEDADAPVLFMVTDVQPISEGRLAVANGGTNEILVFDGSGHHVETWGGAGEGPGEFQRLQWLAAKSPDTLAAGDQRLKRVSILDANGRFVRSIGTPVLSARSSRSILPQPIGLLRDGTLVAASFRGPEEEEEEEGTIRPAVELFVIDPGDDSPRSLGAFPGPETALVREGEFLSVISPPFHRSLHMEPSPDANGIWVGDDARWEIREYSSRGRLRTVIRSTAKPEAVNDQLLEQHLDHKYRHVGPDIDLEPIKRLQRRIASHATTPSFGVIRPVPGAGVAVGEYDSGVSWTRMWTIVDPGGTVTSIGIPAVYDVKRWGRDWILVVVRDELDREEIHRYPILDGDGG